VHELARVRDLLGQPEKRPEERRVPEEDIPRITELLGRVNEVLRLLTDQFRIIETMPPVHFLAFRDALAPASGFQSVQFREMEILAGLKDSDRIGPAAAYAVPLSRAEREVVERRSKEMSVREALFDWLRRTPVDEAFPGFAESFGRAFLGYLREQRSLQEQNPTLAKEAKAEALALIDRQTEAMHRYLSPGDKATARAHAAFLFIASYRGEPLLGWPYTLVEKIVEFEEGLRLMRYRHARMVERMIGVRVGTGGTAGASYLDATAFRYRVFGDLLEARNFLLRADLLPPLPRPDVLAFRRGR
jgi:tryptophan 2,3-dioxygenase